ncbi:MAG: hypothetical protein O3A37_12385 [Planctomycetota bacterium]|nr:hypothetical protein [Planctomycetota bacterium]
MRDAIEKNTMPATIITMVSGARPLRRTRPMHDAVAPVRVVCFVLVMCVTGTSAADQTVPRPRLTIINGSQQEVAVNWLRNETDRVSNGLIPPGGQSTITTTLGHQFEVVGSQDGSRATVLSTALIQGFRFDPASDHGIPKIYTQVLHADGFPIVATRNTNPYALQEAAWLIRQMLAGRPDVRDAMIGSGARLCVMAHDEFTTDLPEFVRLTPKDYWDARARGLGGSDTDPFCSCGEENLLAFPGDPYSTECILIHEFAHNIHLRGMMNVDPTFDHRLRETYERAMAAGLWKGKYASVNHHEYFAEGVQSWFDDNRENDHDHNHVNTRDELVAYDPRLAALCREVFGDTQLKYTKPTTRLHGHMEGYDPRKAPTFRWPDRLDQARREIRQAAEARSGQQ